MADVERATRLFTVLIDGAIVAAQASRDPSYADDAQRAAAALLGLDDTPRPHADRSRRREAPQIQ